ncbi:MAG: roadblock/LC7 domain-containing protein [Chloroflexi bacterium]|nr:roadblock/LC7 domain-containing protein [Chloroflexota bacterium]MCY3583830.1 roadblock/LC7 domain-containing protein [Chloroflexota bacterium]
MSDAPAERLAECLNSLRASTPGLEAAAVTSVEGIIIAASLPDDLGGARIDAMSAAMLALGERIAAELGRGELEQVFIKGRAGYALLQALDENCQLVVLASEDAQLGLLFLDMRAAGEDLRKLLT